MLKIQQWLKKPKSMFSWQLNPKKGGEAGNKWVYKYIYNMSCSNKWSKGKKKSRIRAQRNMGEFYFINTGSRWSLFLGDVWAETWRKLGSCVDMGAGEGRGHPGERRPLTQVFWGRILLGVFREASAPEPIGGVLSRGKTWTITTVPTPQGRWVSIERVFLEFLSWLSDNKPD